MFSSTHQHYHHGRKEWQALLHISSTMRTSTNVLTLWTETRNLLGYAQKQIEATKLYKYSHIQRRLKPLPPLSELLNTKKTTEWTRARIADLAEKIQDKRQWPEKAIQAAIALRSKGATRYARLKYRLRNSAGKSVRFILPTDLDLTPPAKENPVAVPYARKTVIKAVSKSSLIKANDSFITTKAVLKTSKIKNNNSITISTPPAAGASKIKKKKRRSYKRKSNMNVSGLLPAERSSWIAPLKTCATNARFKSSEYSKAETVVSTTHDCHSGPSLRLIHRIHPIHQDCTPGNVLPQEMPVLHQLLSENNTALSMVKLSSNKWTHVRLGDLAEAVPNRNLWPKEAIEAAFALRPKHISPWYRYKYRCRTSSGKTIRISLPREKKLKEKQIFS